MTHKPLITIHLSIPVRFLGSLLIAAIPWMQYAHSQSTIYLDFDTLTSGANPVTHWPWGTTSVTNASIGSIIDPDIIAAGGAGQGAYATGTFYEGTITLSGAIGTSIEFLYGATGNSPPNSGGFKAAVYRNGVQGESIYQGGTWNGAPAGPAVLNGPASAGGHFDTFRWSTTFPGGRAEIDNVRITILTNEEFILRDSVQVTTNGPEIRASFNPAGGSITVEKAAEMLGVDGFNWIQTVKVPNLWSPRRLHDVSFFDNGTVTVPQVNFNTPHSNGVHQGNPAIPDGTPVDATGVFQPFYDPIVQEGTSGIDTYFFLVSDLVKHPLPPDGVPYVYWDQTYDSPRNGILADGEVFYYETINNNQPFYDKPMQPAWSLSDSEAIEFETKLVGVKQGADGSWSYISWKGLGTNFTWSSDAVHSGLGSASNVGYSFTSPDGIYPEVIRGGVFDVKFDVAIPEPASALLLVLGAATFLSVTNLNKPRGRVLAPASRN